MKRATHSDCASLPSQDSWNRSTFVITKPAHDPHETILGMTLYDPQIKHILGSWDILGLCTSSLWKADAFMLCFSNPNVWCLTIFHLAVSYHVTDQQTINWIISVLLFIKWSYLTWYPHFLAAKSPCSIIFTRWTPISDQGDPRGL